MIYGKCPDLYHTQYMPDFNGGDDLISSYYGTVRYFSWKSLVYATSQESPTNTYFNLWGTTSGLPTGYSSYNIYEGIRYAYNFLNNIGSVPDISEANLRYCAWISGVINVETAVHHTVHHSRLISPDRMTVVVAHGSWIKLTGIPSVTLGRARRFVYHRW
jgi:hypothetical protein